MAGTGSFKQALLNFGVPQMLVGNKSEVKRDWTLVKYPAVEEEDDEYEIARATKDPEGEKIRELFMQMRKLYASVESEDPGLEKRNTWATSLKFVGRDTKISPAGKRELKGISERLKNYATSEKLTICVVGYALDVKGYSQQMTLSAKRARSAEKYLRTVLAQHLHSKWRIRSIGTAENNRWSSQFSGNVKGQYISIAVIAE